MHIYKKGPNASVATWLKNIAAAAITTTTIVKSE